MEYHKKLLIVMLVSVIAFAVAVSIAITAKGNVIELHEGGLVDLTPWVWSDGTYTYMDDPVITIEYEDGYLQRVEAESEFTRSSAWCYLNETKHWVGSILIDRPGIGYRVTGCSGAYVYDATVITPLGSKTLHCIAVWNRYDPDIGGETVFQSCPGLMDQ